MPIKVWVVPYGRKYLQLQWVDPVTGKRRTKSAQTDKQSLAQRKAADLEKELNSQEPKDDGSMSWNDFVERYKLDHLRSLSHGSYDRASGVLRMLGQHSSPKNIRSVTTHVLRDYFTWLRRNNRSEATIALHVRTLHAALAWAVEAGHMPYVPTFPKVKRAGEGEPQAKGRPLTTSEFVKMLRSTKDVVGHSAAKSWRRLLRGLWLSGLRLGESLELGWSPRFKLWIDADSGKFPVLVIRATGEKGGRNRTLPLTKDFAEWILRTPKSDRIGKVFRLEKQRHKDKEVGVVLASKIITQIGEKSGVIVAETGKYASAHDLRRSFGLRWASQMEALELRYMMRHSDLKTTQTYYALFEAQAFAAKLWSKTP